MLLEAPENYKLYQLVKEVLAEQEPVSQYQNIPEYREFLGHMSAVSDFVSRVAQHTKDEKAVAQVLNDLNQFVSNIQMMAGTLKKTHSSLQPTQPQINAPVSMSNNDTEIDSDTAVDLNQPQMTDIDPNHPNDWPLRMSPDEIEQEIEKRKELGKQSDQIRDAFEILNNINKQPDPNKPSWARKSKYENPTPEQVEQAKQILRQYLEAGIITQQLIDRGLGRTSQRRIGGSGNQDPTV